MSRLAAGILGLLNRGPYTSLELAQALDERVATIRRECELLESRGVVQYTLDGWDRVKDDGA